MKRTRIISSVMVLALVSALVAGLPSYGQETTPEATITTEFTYQGRLTDDAGHPIDDTCDFRFRLYNDVGSQVGLDQTPNDVGVTAGYFTVLLDFGDRFDGTALWLDVAVWCTGDDDYVPLSPRQKLTAAPNALYARLAAHATTADEAGYATIAGDAETLDGYHVTDLALATHGHYFLNAADGSPGQALYVDNEGEVGIGLTTPGHALQVQNVAGDSSPTIFVNQGAPRNFTGTAPEYPNFATHTYVSPWSSYGMGQTEGLGLVAYENDTGDPHYGNIIFYTGGDGVLAAERMRIDYDGDVGIGTNNPSTRLDVAGGSVRTSWQFISMVNTGNPPLVVSSETRVDHLNADLLDGYHAADLGTSHTHPTLTAGTGLSGGSYNGGSPATFTVAYGISSGKAVEGNQTASITAGSGLTGGVSNDFLGDGLATTLNVGGGNGIAASADDVALGTLTANWNQGGAFDIVLNNASSELQILESGGGGADYGVFDVGVLAGNQTYTFGTGGTVWTSGNDGSPSGLDADLLDGWHETEFFRLNEAETVTGRPYFSNAAGPFTVSNQIRVNNLNADLLDSLHEADFFRLNEAEIVAGRPTFDNATGPFQVSSTNLVSSLNADLLDGQHASALGTTHNHWNGNWGGSGIGLQLTSSNSNAIYGTTSAGAGTAAVQGNNTSNGYGVFGSSSSGYGVYGEATAGSGTTVGAYGKSASSAGYGVYGDATAGSGNTYGVYGRSFSNDGYGIYGSNAAGGNAIYGYTTSSTGYAAVTGMNNSAGNGVYGSSMSGYGIFGYSNSNHGVYGSSGSGSSAGVHGYNSSSGDGVYGQSSSGNGVNGQSTSGDGVSGVSASSDGVEGTGSIGGHFGNEPRQPCPASRELHPGRRPDRRVQRPRPRFPDLPGHRQRQCLCRRDLQLRTGSASASWCSRALHLHHPGLAGRFCRDDARPRRA